MSTMKRLQEDEEALLLVIVASVVLHGIVSKTGGDENSIAEPGNHVDRAFRIARHFINRVKKEAPGES